VLLNASLNISCDACVKSPVGALYDVGVPHEESIAIFA